MHTKALELVVEEGAHTLYVRNWGFRQTIARGKPLIYWIEQLPLSKRTSCPKRQVKKNSESSEDERTATSGRKKKGKKGKSPP